MKTYFNQLGGLLEKKLDCFYLISGEEPLQLMEAGDLIRSVAKKHAYEQRHLFFVDSGFDWQSVVQQADNLSLFSQRRIIDIRLGATKLAGKGNDFFKRVLEAPPSDVLFIVQASKVDGRSAWVKRVSEKAVWIQVYSKNYSETKSWLIERMLRNNLNAEDGVVEIIAQRSEGNLLSAAQEIEKLKLNYENKTISLQQAEQVIGDSAHYSVYELADAAVCGDAERALRILNSLQSEAAPEQLILWSLANTIRTLIKMEYRITTGESPPVVINTVWKSKQATFRKALQRKLKSRWLEMLYACYDTDLAIKGQSLEDSRQQLHRLVLTICGVPVLEERLNSRIL